MSTGNYDHGNFVRVDCAVSAKQFYTNAVHEVAHFTLIKQTFFGLLCFYLRQDTRDARSPLALGLRTLEQAFECTNECYARVKELLICTRFSGAGPQEREALLASQRTQAYYSRYHMERLEPILRQYDLAARCPIFPDRLFLMAAEIEAAPLLDCGFERLPQLQSLMLSRPEDVYPDHRLALLLQAFCSLLQRDPPERITEKRLAREAGLSCTPLSTRSMKRFFRRMAAAFPSRPMLQALLLGNLQRLSAAPYPAPTAENLETSFRLSLSDCVIPGALEPRFELHTNEPPSWRGGRSRRSIPPWGKAPLPDAVRRMPTATALTPGMPFGTSFLPLRRPALTAAWAAARFAACGFGRPAGRNAGLAIDRPSRVKGWLGPAKVWPGPGGGGT